MILKAKSVPARGLNFKHRHAIGSYEIKSAQHHLKSVVSVLKDNKTR